ncbi:hypothetical protein [Herbiconiux daphne]|uniref:Uncharacterized protein n=1 Tax=Herbiconiux daphne TaxID=2970914 RepID=A0ABT2HBF0_9MICO|nr:hypothetical protein [Herbiconiux daphne]MCS5737229.1 hypothetical protein [Herbiconiux daphne]
MHYELSNGVKVNLCNNFETAKFLLFKFPLLHVTFVGAIPHMVVNAKIEKLIQVKRRVEMNREIKQRRILARQEFIDADLIDPWDDDIPF